MTKSKTEQIIQPYKVLKQTLNWNYPTLTCMCTVTLWNWLFEYDMDGWSRIDCCSHGLKTSQRDCIMEGTVVVSTKIRRHTWIALSTIVLFQQDFWTLSTLMHKSAPIWTHPASQHAQLPITSNRLTYKKTHLRIFHPSYWPQQSYQLCA